MIGMQVRYEDGAEFLQHVDNVCTAEMTIQLTEGVLTAVKQHGVVVTSSKEQKHIKTTAMAKNIMHIYTYPNTGPLLR